MNLINLRSQSSAWGEPQQQSLWDSGVLKWVMYFDQINLYLGAAFADEISFTGINRVIVFS